MADESQFNDALYAWYVNELANHSIDAKSHSAFLFGSIKVFISFFILCGIVFALRFMMHLAIDDYVPDGEYRFLGVATVVLSIEFAIAWYIYVSAKVKINLFQLMHKKDEVFVYDYKKITLIKEAVEQLATRMNIDPNRIRYWGILNRSKFPSIEENPQDSYYIELLIPVNFILLFTKNRKEGIAILAHELGHVLQDDTTLFLSTDAYFTVIRSILFPVAMANVVLQVIFLAVGCYTSNLMGRFFDSPGLMLLLLFAVVYNVALYRYLTVGFEKLRESRRVSEKLADTASTIFSDGNDLIAVLKKVPSAGTKSIATHPATVDRINHIQDLLNPLNYVDDYGIPGAQRSHQKLSGSPDPIPKIRRISNK